MTFKAGKIKYKFLLFAGRCGHGSPCDQLCYELHDGMFECDCKDGFFLHKNGYSCLGKWRLSAFLYLCYFPFQWRLLFWWREVRLWNVSLWFFRCVSTTPAWGSAPCFIYKSFQRERNCKSPRLCLKSHSASFFLSNIYIRLRRYLVIIILVDAQNLEIVEQADFIFLEIMFASPFWYLPKISLAPV